MAKAEYSLFSIEWDPNGQSYMSWGKPVLVDYMGKPAISIEKHDYRLDSGATM